MRPLVLSLLLAGCLEPPREDVHVTRTPPKHKPEVAARNAAASKENVPPPLKPPHPLYGVSEELAKNYFSFWPKSKDPYLANLKKRVYWYELPKVAQVDGQVVAVSQLQLTANNEFPWNETAGLVPGTNAKKIHFTNVDRALPVLDKTVVQNGDFYHERYFQEGTVFGELVLVTDPSGYDHPSFLRIRTRHKNEDRIKVYKPTVTEDDFKDALARRGYQYTPGDPYTIPVNSGHANNPFLDLVSTVNLPAVPVEVTNDILDNSNWELVVGDFRESESDSGVTIVEPTTSSYNVLPINYVGFAINADSCARCHSDAGNVVNLAGDMRWRQRGGNGNFSFEYLHDFQSFVAQGVVVPIQ
jgi:hypothetical protein